MQLGLQSLRLLVMALGTALGACAGSPPVPVKPFELKPRELDVKFRHGSPPAALLFPPRYSTRGEDGVILEPPAASPPRPPTGTTVSGLAAQCDPLHYLLDRANAEDATGIDNRFSWWTKTAPDSGPLRPPALADPIATRNSLICHFHPALARVVGASSTRITDAGFMLLSWDDRSIATANQIAGLEFIVRRLHPHSVPALRDLDRTGGGTQRVLVNESSGVPPDVGGDRVRPSLWFDFAMPQRAVAVEFGIPLDTPQSINLAGAKLIGYDRHGRVLRMATADGASDLRSDGRVYGSDVDIAPGDFGNVVGIRDRGGRIASVELRFDFVNADALDEGGDPGEKIVAPQIVQRIWHEPLPPAAVLHGFVGVSTFVPAASPPPGVIVPPTFEQLFGKAPGAETIRVPFGLDRAVVMIRGVRWQFAHPSPHPVTELSAGIAPTGVVELAGDTPELRITPSGRIVGEAGSMHEFHTIVDYLVLAWRSTEVELFAGPGNAASARTQNNQAVSRVMVSDPCPFSSTSLTVERRRELCGPLFGAPQGFAIRMDAAQEIDRMDLIIASETGLASRQGLSLHRSDQDGQPVVVWEQGVSMEGSDDDAHRLEFAGTMLTGTSLRVGPDALGSPIPHAVRNAANPQTFPRADTGPRDDRNSYGFGAQIHRDLGIAWPVVADIGFVAFEQLYTEPDGPLQQLDFEVAGAGYEGTVIDWKTGLGINTEPAIIGGAGATRKRFIAATALFGAVDNVPPFSLGAGAKRDVVFESGVLGLTQRAVDIPGFVENNSRDVLWIDDVRRGSQPGDDLFELDFLFSRHPMERGSGSGLNFVRVSEAGIHDRLPLLLRPGERITILGRYTPAAATTFLPDMGSVEFVLRTGLNRSLRVFALGTAAEAHPAGEWRPNELVFTGQPGPVAPQAQVAVLVGTGSTPLAVSRFFFEDANLGYRFEVLPQIESDVLGVRVVCGDANTACQGQTRLIADSNAGPLALTVRLAP